MKNKLKIGLLALAAVLFASCYYVPLSTYGGGGGGGGGYVNHAVDYSSGNRVTYDTYDSSEQWVDASYDSNGFPIYGYEYGRPIYGYNTSGIAIYSYGLLRTTCYAPSWNPAPWYRGKWRYNRHIHRYAAPPHYPRHHRPHCRPHGGTYAPINRHPRDNFQQRPRSKNYSSNKTINNIEINKNSGNKYTRPSTRPSGNKYTRPSTRPSGNTHTRPSGNTHTRPSTRPSGNTYTRPSTRPSGNTYTRPSGNTYTRPSTRPSGNTYTRPNTPPSGNKATRRNSKREGRS